METAVFFSLYSGDRTNKNFSTARRYLNDGNDDYNYTVDFGGEEYVEFRVCVKAASRGTAIAKALAILKADYSPLHLVDHDLIKAERKATIRTWWENEFDNSIYFDRKVAFRQEASLNRMIEEMRSDKDCKWSVQFVN